MIKAILTFSKLPITATVSRLIINNFRQHPFSPQNSFGFSQGESSSSVESSTNPQNEGENRASNFYRNSIRRININEKGRGKFTEHHLLRLIKLTERVEQEPLLFEAYYNYIGHFTMISSTTVDKMLLKSMSFEGCSRQRIIEIFQNHNHLSYFPSYTVTEQLIQLIKPDQQSYQKLLNVFIHNPLIKFHAEIINILLQDFKDIRSNTTLSILIKLLVQRAHLGLFEGLISGRQMLSAIVQSVESRLDSGSFKPFRRSQTIGQWSEEILSTQNKEDTLHYQIAILSVNFKNQKMFADNLILINDHQKVLKCLLYLEQCPESFQKATVKYLLSLQISEELKVRLQEFRPSTTQPETVQTE